MPAKKKPPPSLPDTSDEEEMPVTTEEQKKEQATFLKLFGEGFEINDKASTVGEVTPLYKKEQRKILTPDKLQELFVNASKKQHKKYDLIPMSMNDEDQLDDTYNLDILVRQTRDSHVKYDVHNVYSIVGVEADGKTLTGTVKDLFTDYANISEDEVAASNQWYATWPKPDWFRDNPFRCLMNSIRTMLKKNYGRKCLIVTMNSRMP